MTDLTHLLRRGAEEPALPLDLPAVLRRSRQLSRRRTAMRGVSALAALSVAGLATVAVTQGTRRDVLTPAAPTPPAATPLRTVDVVFSSGCADLRSVQRTVPANQEPLRATLQQLFAGPTEQERQLGTTSVSFSTRTAPLLRSVHVAHERAYVDLVASVATGLQLGIPPGCDRSPFGEQIAVTLQKFPGVHGVVYALDGDPLAYAKAVGATCPATAAPASQCDPESFRATTTDPAASTTPCRDQDLLAVAAGGGSISNGFTGATIRLTNVGSSSCLLAARPTSLGTTDTPLPMKAPADDHASPHILRPGGVVAFEIASMRLQGSGNCLRPAPAAASTPKQLVIKFDQTSAAIVAGRIGGGQFTLACWPIHVGGLYTPDAASAPGPNALWPADAGGPNAGACESYPGPEVLVEVNPDTAMPRCSIIRPDQRLRVRNTSNRFSQLGRAVIMWFAGYPARTVQVGADTVFAQPAGQYLAPGVHYLRLSLYAGSGGAEIWLQR